MQKTQVMKLNTSKDNVQAFFNKMKHKLSQHQTRPQNNQNYDITMIVKHQSKNSFKQNILQPAQQKYQTAKSILTQNDQNTKNYPSNKKNKPKIYDEDMQLQSRILPSDLSIKQQISQKANLSNDALTKSGKVRDSNKMPSIASLFNFQKKKQDNQSNQQIKTKKSTFSNSKLDKNLKVQEEYNEDGGSSDEEASQNSQAQQRFQQDLKKHISRKHIDIFPNIEINGVVSDRLLSLKSIKFNRGRALINQKRRCSINNEDLLSPRIKNLVSEQIKQESHRNITSMIKNKVNQTEKSLRNVILSNEQINEAKNTQDQNEQLSSPKDSQYKDQVQQFDASQAEQFQKKIKIQKKVVRKQTRDRSSALAKKSIFQSSQIQSNRRNSKIKIDFNDRKGAQVTDKSNHHLQIQVQPLELNPTEETQSEQDDDKSSNSSNQEPQDSIYVIENKLNDCIRLLQKNELSVLEDFLYEFKDKYFYVSNTRIQIKWRLLMAHCKENKKEFQRAAINYNNVIDSAKQNPKSLIIQPAEVYHRLGVCYSQIGWWNKGILAFTEALNRYKRCKNAIKYSECMNNLGTLYLQAKSINLAQKCFIQSYNLKKGLYGKNNTKLLTSLFNIFECNLLTKNYDQAEKVVQMIDDEIISRISENQPNKLLYLGGLYRRKGKMEFLRGNNQEAQDYYLKSFQKLCNKYPYCMQFGQLMSCLGLLKLQDNKYKQSKQYYDKAIMLMNFYCSKDSKTILTLKRNLQYSVKMIKEEKQGWSSKRSTN